MGPVLTHIEKYMKSGYGYRFSTMVGFVVTLLIIGPGGWPAGNHGEG